METAISQEKRVTILNFVNSTGDDSNSTLTSTTQSIIDSGIRYIGSFKVLPTPSFTIGTDVKTLREYAGLTGSEYIIYGSFSVQKKGPNLLEGHLYNLADGSIYTTKEEVENVFDIFSASDSLSLAILSKLHNMKIAYGTISLGDEKDPGKFDVYVNDVLAGSNVMTVGNIPDGYKNVRVVSRSGDNDRQVVFNDRVLVKGDSTVSVAVAFHGAGVRVPERKSVVATGKNGILSITSDPDGMLVTIDGGEEQSTPVSIEATPGQHKFEVSQTTIDGRIYAAEESQWVSVTSGNETLIPLKPKMERARIDMSVVPEDYRIFLDNVELAGDRSEPIDCPAGYLQLSVRKDGLEVCYLGTSVDPGSIGKMPWGSNINIPFQVEKRDVEFVRDSHSWNDIKPVYRTEYPRVFMGDTKYGATSIWLARDGKYLYWYVEFKETNPVVLVPRGIDSCELLLTIEDGKNYYGFNCGVKSDNSSYFGKADWKKKSWDDYSIKPSFINTGKTLTARILLSELKKRGVVSIYSLKIITASPGWKYHADVNIGMVDFSFLAK
jgi:hypothetical protein